MAVKDEVLKALENSKGNYISGEELSQKLNVSRAAVWKGIKSLREEGFVIEAVTNKGYRMPLDKDAITKDAVRLSLPLQMRNNDILVFDTIDSTNVKAKQLVVEGKIGHGSAIIASQQTAGRGRLGRSFHSPKNGLYLSVVIKPDFEMSKSTLVTVATAVAVAEAIDDVCGCEEPAKIKWVNDIYLNNKKVCGILTEAIADFETGSIDSLIIGVGINTSTKGFPDELKSIAGAVEGQYSRAQLAAKVIAGIIDHVKEISDDLPGFIETYRERSLLTGREIKVYKGVYRKDPADEISGIKAEAMGIDDEGGLIVMYESGETETLTTGEVSVRLD